jgi:superfamily II RNA helicase
MASPLSFKFSSTQKIPSQEFSSWVHKNTGSFTKRLPPVPFTSNEIIFEVFLDEIASKNLELYPAQEEAIFALFENKNVILNTPTGSGKSLVAAALHLKSFAWGRRSIYTCPIKALVNEKFISLCKDFGPQNVGMVTGDFSVNPNAPVLCCTAEILSNMALRFGTKTPYDDIIIDEFHYYSDRERGQAWQIPLLTLKDSRFLLMSATLGDTEFFQSELTKLNGLSTSVIKSSQRPVPLEFSYQEIPLHETISSLLKTNKFPIYLVNFTQMDAADEAQNFLSIDFCTKEEKKLISEELVGVKFQSPYGKEMDKLLRHGIGLHHAGLLPKYRVLVEKLAQKGLLKIISGTDTLGVGVNVPIRTVVFTKMCKFDGLKTTILSVRDFQQISGRAGRKGFDSLGHVCVQAPEHIIENLRLEQKALGDAKKTKKLVRKKPPEKGFLPWNKETFERLRESSPEQLVSHFSVSHGLVLNVLSREENGVEALKNLIRNCHETAVTKKKLRGQAFKIFRSLLERNIVEAFKLNGGWQVRVNVELQLDFSLNQELSLFLVDTLSKINFAEENHAIKILSLVESIHENPEIILRKQVNKLKTKKMYEMKLDGLEFEERMAELEKIEHPKPEKDFIYDSFNQFSALHPWIGSESVKVKSVAREMFENFFSFDEYIQEYEIQRSEGLLLRYISYVYKSLAQTIPDPIKTESLREIEIYFENIIQEVDSSLLEEWKSLSKKQTEVALPKGWQPEDIDEIKPDITQNKKQFLVLLRNEIFKIMRLLAQEKIPQECKNILNIEEGLKRFKEENREVVLNANARNHKNTTIKNSELEIWEVEQVLVDTLDMNDSYLVLSVDLEKCRLENKVVLELQEWRF